MVIMKFGGTSVEDAPAIERVAEIVRTREKLRPVVVVSALAKVTDTLVLVGQSAATGDIDSALKLSDALRARHLETTFQLLGKKSSASVTPQIEA
jgi:aspartate kinase